MSRRVFACAAVAVALVGCSFGDRPASTDAGADPDISACCDWFNPVLRALHYVDDPQVCLDEHTAVGECRWLHCLGGVVEYQTTGCV